MSASFLHFGTREIWGGQRPFGLLVDDRARHLFVLGQTGTGKSTLLRRIVAQDIARGDGITLIDPHGDLSAELYDYMPGARIDDVVVFDPRDHAHAVGFNPFYRIAPDDRPLAASNIVATFRQVWAESWGPRLEYILYNTVAAVLDAPDHLRPSFLSIPRVLVEDEYRAHLLRHVTDARVRSFFVDEYNRWNERQRAEALSSVQNKIGQVVSNPFVRNILGQWRPSLQLDAIIRDRRVLIVRLPKGQTGETQANLLGSFIVSGLVQAAMSQPAQGRVRHHLVIDEFQNFTTQSFASILSEARKFGLSLVVGTQFCSQLSAPIEAAIFGNVGNIIAFRTGADDADRLVHEFGGFRDAVFRDLERGQVLARITQYGEVVHPFIGQIDPNTPSFGTAGKVIAKSRRAYGRPRDVVERRLSRWFAADSQRTP